MKNKKIILIIGVLILAFFWVGQNIIKRPVEENITERTSAQADAPSKAIRQSADMRGKSGNVLPDKAILEINEVRLEGEITESSNIYDFMNKLREDKKIDFTERNFSGMGKFIETINGISGNGAENWIYYINGKKGQIGVSNYKLRPGDVVSWKYEKSY